MSIATQQPWNKKDLLTSVPISISGFKRKHEQTDTYLQKDQMKIKNNKKHKNKNILMIKYGIPNYVLTFVQERRINHDSFAILTLIKAFWVPYLLVINPSVQFFFVFRTQVQRTIFGQRRGSIRYQWSL